MQAITHVMKGAVGITQLWIAVSVYALVAIVKKYLKLVASLDEILPILSLTMFERMPLGQLLIFIVLVDIDDLSKTNCFCSIYVGNLLCFRL